jgi:cbb3-type cytochrome oxidase maturation protein
MDILYLLIPFSALLVLAILALFAWAIEKGQFEDLDREGVRILGDDRPAFDIDQGEREPSTKECPRDHQGRIAR